MTEPDQTGWFDAEAATFGDRLAGAREALGLSQTALARNLGVRLKTIQAWEGDLSEPRANHLQMLAGMLNVSIRWFLTGEGEGLDAPTTKGLLSEPARQALADLARMRAQVASLSKEMGQIDKRLRELLREDIE